MAPVSESPPGLRRDEEVWLGAFERLQERFPFAGPSRIAQALRDANGHAGRAAAALRCSPLHEGSSPEAKSGHRPGHAEDIEHFSEEFREERKDPCTADTLAAKAQEELRASLDALRGTHQKKAFDAEVTNDDSSPSLVAALELRGQKLRHELDEALAAARAERLSADSVAACSFSFANAEAAAAAAERRDAALVQLFRSEATSAALSSQRLLSELESSRDEGRRLKQELEKAVGAASTDNATAEREKLCRELEAGLAESMAAAAANVERRKRHSENAGQSAAPSKPFASSRPEKTARVNNSQVPGTHGESLHHQGREGKEAEGQSLGSAFPDSDWYRVPLLGSGCRSSCSRASFQSPPDPSRLSSEQFRVPSAQNGGEPYSSSRAPFWKRDHHQEIFDKLQRRRHRLGQRHDTKGSGLFADKLRSGFGVPGGSPPSQRFTCDVKSGRGGPCEHDFKVHSSAKIGGKTFHQRDLGQEYRCERERIAERLAELRSMFSKAANPTFGAGDFEVPRFASWH